MKKSLLLFFFIISLAAQAQNLVPNPSFEDTVLCPHLGNQMDRAMYWHASKESPEYFNACDMITGNGTVGVPNNFCGFQYANTGDAYAGFIAFSRSAPNAREYFTCQLINNLIIGSHYNVSMFINWAGSISRTIACNKIGMLFSTVNYNMISNAPTGNYCQFYSDSIVSDSINWVFLSGNFIADSAYAYLTIGNLFVDSLTDTLYFPPTSHAYYYVDDISVVEDIKAGTDELLSSQAASLYPNPARDFIVVRLPGNSENKIEIANASGIVQKNITAKENITEFRILIKDLLSGIYFVKISNQKTILFHKFVKL